VFVRPTPPPSFALAQQGSTLTLRRASRRAGGGGVVVPRACPVLARHFACAPCKRQGCSSAMAGVGEGSEEGGRSDGAGFFSLCSGFLEARPLPNAPHRLFLTGLSWAFWGHDAVKGEREGGVGGLGGRERVGALRRRGASRVSWLFRHGGRRCGVFLFWGGERKDGVINLGCRSQGETAKWNLFFFLSLSGGPSAHRGERPQEPKVRRRQ